MIKIVIVDDHPLVREGLKNVLKSTNENIDIYGEASNAEDLYSLLETKQPDAIVLDIELPGKNGLDILKELKNKYVTVPVLVLSMHPPERFAVRCFKAGASGYLSKSSIPEELESAVCTVSDGNRKYINQAVAEKLAEQIDDYTGRPLHLLLSDREYQVMCMLAMGQSICDIAEMLSLSVRTVHTYRSRMMDKMKLKTNVDIAHYAITNQLID